MFFVFQIKIIYSLKEYFHSLRAIFGKFCKKNWNYEKIPESLKHKINLFVFPISLFYMCKQFIY